jgi:iron complex transport system substrate-binding protein
MVSVADSLGREVRVPVNPERVACLYAFTGHVTTLLDKGPDIVAAVEGLKRDKLLTQMVPEILTAFIPLSADKINVEELIKSDPDLIFIREDSAKDEREIEQLDKTGIPYLVISDTTMEEQMEAIGIIGKALGKEAEADEYLDFYQGSIDRVKAVIDEIPKAERVRVFHSVNEATRTDFKDTLPAEWTAVAGAINVSVDSDLRFTDNKYFASLEQIYLWEPDVILAHEDAALDYIRTNEQWAALDAVRSGKVFKMPNGISRWGHPGSLETPLAILWTAKTLYPDRFTDLDMTKETKDFYLKFFDIELSDESVADILAGSGMRIPK